MKLVEIEGTYFNPEQVVVVREHAGHTMIWVSAGGGTHDGPYFTVDLPVKEVVALLTA
jgi:hypothetical protein